MQILFDSANGTLQRFADFPSRYVPRRHIDLWLPPGYAADAERRYPVIYMHDGQNLFLPELAYGGVTWGVAEAIQRLMHTGQLAGAIVVGIWNGGENRWREYLPQKPMDTPAGRQFATRFADRLSGAPTSDSYLRFLVEEVKPLVDAACRTLPDCAHTVVMGSSMGGLISLYALSEYPHVFGRAGCLSTHWPAGETLLLDYFGGALPAPGQHKLYFDYGTETLDAAYEPFQLQMDDRLRQAGYTPGKDWLTRKFEGADHSEKSWRERVHIPLEFLLGAN